MCIKGSAIPARNRLKTLQTFDQSALVFFTGKEALKLRPEHSGRNISGVFSPFLARIAEPFIVHATASWESSLRAYVHTCTHSLSSFLSVVASPERAAEVSLPAWGFGLEQWTNVSSHTSPSWSPLQLGRPLDQASCLSCHSTEPTTLLWLPENRPIKSRGTVSNFIVFDIRFHPLLTYSKCSSTYRHYNTQ